MCWHGLKPHSEGAVSNVSARASTQKVLMRWLKLNWLQNGMAEKVASPRLELAPPRYEPVVDSRDAGSARTLTGRCYNVCVFISHNLEQGWTRRAKEDMFEKVRAAERWALRQAEVWGAPLEFIPASCFGLEEDIRPVRFPAAHTDPTVHECWAGILAQLGWPGRTLFEWAKAHHQAENVAVLLFSSAAGRSFAMPFCGHPSCQWLEAAVIYRRQVGFSVPTNGALIAHEIMHLYGAWDLYAEGGFTLQQEKLAQRLYPSDIMLGPLHTLRTATISPLTAWRIGWHQPASTVLFQRLRG